MQGRFGVSFVATKLRRRPCHALTILHNILSASLPEIHAKRLTSLLAAVEAVVSGSRLTLSDLGRGLSGQAAVKHNIKRIDRLLGNDALHTETPKLYEALVQQYVEGISMPLIVIDWSDLTTDRQWQLLRASVAIEGRSMTLYEEVRPQSRATSPRVHCIRRFSPSSPRCSLRAVCRS